MKNGGASGGRRNALSKGTLLSVQLKVDPFPSNTMMHELWRSAWGACEPKDFTTILERSLAHIGAYEGERLIGFVNIAWDGGVHAFLLDTCVHPGFRRQGIGKRLVKEAVTLARKRGTSWLHVDYEAHLEGFYADCGFRPTKAGLIRLAQE